VRKYDLWYSKQLNELRKFIKLNRIYEKYMRIKIPVKFLLKLNAQLVVSFIFLRNY